MNETIADLARSGRLEGRRVRFLGEDIPTWVPKGTCGIVVYVPVPYEHPRAVVHFVREDLPETSVWRRIDLETRLRNLELAE